MTLRANSETRVLLVEDDLLLAMDMEDFLVDQGFQVVGPFGRLAQALQALSGQPVDLAIVDLNLAGELSFPLIDTLRRRETPIIVCSGYAELPEIRSKLADLPLIAKPWSPQALTKRIDEVLNTRMAERG
ncbi:response regulator (plasmid) [Sinorhizobium sp. B11]|jgi:DNA-binding response OmpR family regulator